jgi:hypothetical protein
VQLARTTPEQRSEIYDDVRSLIVPGFLSHVVSVGTARFVLRTLDRADWELLEYRSWGLPTKEWKAWCVATSVWMVNGSVVDDEDSTCRLFETFSNLPEGVIEMLYSVLNGLMRRVIAASQITEGFLYETESRSLWSTEGRAIVDRRLTRRVQRFHNPVISLWIYYNQMEDRREREEQDWTLTKFMVGPHAPKSVKKLNSQDNQRTNDMKRRRESIQDRVYYEAKGLVARKDDKDGASAKKPFQEVIMAETPEELQESMRRWVAGIKDDHDNVVDNVKAKIKYEVEKRKEDAAKRRRALDDALQEEGFSRNQLTPLGGEAGKKFLERMRSRMPGARTVVDDHTHNSAYKKYIENNPDVGDLHVDDEGNIVSRTPVTAEMLEVLTKPDASERPSLQEQIESRRPTATFVDEGED